MLYCFDGLRIVVDDSQRHGIHNVVIVQLLWDRSLRVVCGRGIGPADFPHPTCQQ